ncbi:class I SAM-dependent methyltransferase [Microcoleus sp. ZQ-A2]
MHYQKFIQQLPDLYENWNQISVSPKSHRFAQVLQQLKGMTTANVMQLLNFAVDCLEPDEIYCEVGCFQGSTLIGALLDHPNQMAYAVDNFSEFDTSGENIEKLIENLTKFNLKEQVCFCNQSFEEFFVALRTMQTADKIGVYFYDGAHDYRSQLLGLLLVKPFLADQALIIVDDSNWLPVKQANWDFMATHPQCHLLLDIQTAQDGHWTFWNGLHVLSWDINSEFNYDWSTLEQFRQPSVIESIYQLRTSR